MHKKQDKTPMSNSSMKLGRKIQEKEYRKKCKQEGEIWQKENDSIINALRNSPSVHSFNNLDE